MIPEKWDRVYLYASVIDKSEQIQTGEMFFYYYPKSILKKNPVNVYEVPNKFNVDEKAYMKLADKLYEKIKELRNETKKNNEKIWSNLTISIENCQFKIEYHYDDLVKSKYTSYDRHLVWRYKYLGIPITSFSKQEAQMVQKYLSSVEYVTLHTSTYTEGMYRNKKPNSKIIEYNVERSIYKDKINTKLEGEFKKNIKSQILEISKEP